MLCITHQCLAGSERVYILKVTLPSLADFNLYYSSVVIAFINKLENQTFDPLNTNLRLTKPPEI